jgi:hypothetical protein
MASCGFSRPGVLAGEESASISQPVRSRRRRRSLLRLLLLAGVPYCTEAGPQPRVAEQCRRAAEASYERFGQNAGHDHCEPICGPLPRGKPDALAFLQRMSPECSAVMGRFHAPGSPPSGLKPGHTAEDVCRSRRSSWSPTNPVVVQVRIVCMASVLLRADCLSAFAFLHGG